VLRALTGTLRAGGWGQNGEGRDAAAQPAAGPPVPGPERLGLAITVGAIVTLFVLMQATAKTRWNEVFALRAAAGAS